jgi:DNA-binding IclR family transcriptional regulator
VTVNLDDADLGTKGVLARAAMLLDAFAWDKPVLSLNELSVATALPKSTVHRFAERLVELGWLERTLGGYQVGIRIFEVGGLAERRNRLHKVAFTHLQNLSVATKCAVHLAVFDRFEVLYLERLPASGLNPPTYAGGRKPANCTALGKAMLAFAVDGDVEGAINKGLPKLTNRTLSNPAALRDELAKVRETGFSIDNEEYERGTVCVAAPIRGSGRAIGAVSITGRIESFDFQKGQAAVRGTVTNIWNDMFGVGARHAS